MSKIPKLKINKPEGSIKGRVQEIVSFLNDNYEIRVNCFDPTKSEIYSKVKKYEHPVTFDDISLHAWDEGISVSDSMLRKILRSPNYMSTYNPIIEYFESLRGKFKGKSHIDILCSHITARNYFDKEEEGYYQNRLNYIVKKWIVAAVACAYGKHPNDVALGFIQQKEGIGKTWLTEFFTPPALHSFYIKSNKDERVFSMSDAMTRNLYINFDELYGLSTRNIDEFKNMLSAKEVEIKNRGEQFIKTQQRMASVLFTTNHNAELGGFLHKSYGYRRWGTIEVETIDHDYSKHVDINQVYAEAIVLMDGQFDFVWNENDFDMLISYNQRFLIETPLMKLVQLHYTYGIEGDKESKWLRATDIIDELIKSRKITGEILKEISPVKLGEALTTLNYKREAQRIAEGPRYCYLVKSKT